MRDRRGVGEQLEELAHGTGASEPGGCSKTTTSIMWRAGAPGSQVNGTARV